MQEDRTGLRIGLKGREGAVGEDQVGFAGTDEPQAMAAGHTVAVGYLPFRLQAIGVIAAAPIGGGGFGGHGQEADRHGGLRSLDWRPSSPFPLVATPDTCHGKQNRRRAAGGWRR